MKSCCFKKVSLKGIIRSRAIRMTELTSGTLSLVVIFNAQALFLLFKNCNQCRSQEAGGGDFKL